jgi:hypothetical protein
VILTPVDGAIRVVTQVDHQEQCGLLADAWGNAAFARPEPWDAVATAIAWHDEGWRGWEQAPGVLPDGRPRGFTDMALDEHVAIHRASAAAAAALGDRVALLVGMHGVGLVMRRMGLDGPMPPLAERPPPVRQLMSDWVRAARVQRGVIGEGRAVAEWSWSAYRILQAIDLLSLYLTWRGLASGERWTLPRVPRVPGDEAGAAITVTPVDGVTCALDPWPFAGDRVEAPVASRIINDQPYPDATALADALGAAPRRVVPMAGIPA